MHHASFLMETNNIILMLFEYVLVLNISFGTATYRMNVRDIKIKEDCQIIVS